MKQLKLKSLNRCVERFAPRLSLRIWAVSRLARRFSSRPSCRRSHQASRQLAYLNPGVQVHQVGISKGSFPISQPTYRGSNRECPTDSRYRNVPTGAVA